MPSTEAIVRLAVFGGVLAAMLVWEEIAPRRHPAAGRGRRRLNNTALLVVGTAAVRLALPVLATGAALWAHAQGFGLLNAVPLPAIVAVPAAVVLLDLGIYWQHRLLHAVPLLWRLHRVHHTDPDFDVTTALRFHPLEMAVSLLFKLAMVLAIGASPLAVLLFEIILSAAAMFSHGNVGLPAWLERRISPIIITPDLHRVHHSLQPSEQAHNFGFFLAVWDRWFGTLQAQPQGGHAAMAIGQPSFRGPDDQRLDRLLLQPLQSEQ